MGVRQELVRVSVRAVDIFLFFAVVAPVRGVGRLRRTLSVCSGAQVGRRVKCWNSGWLRLPRNAQQSCDRVLPAAPRSRPTGVPLCHRDAAEGQLDRWRSPVPSIPPQTIPHAITSDGRLQREKPDQQRVSHSALQCLRRSRGTVRSNQCSETATRPSNKRP